ncbi:hypothetical protein [Piscinibacter sp.]|uniref:hypothetical protein n=1 Tax=Piscinibacter sp. TaxID=1903157 RepID=UPI002B8CF347|nr:hypothetical protein [Albitalea sp.]HUG21345.1 hypothetical protein [Albitalea sp.]
MNRVLSWPHTAIVPGLLEGIKGERNTTVVTDKGMIRFELLLGPIEMKFSNPMQRLVPGTEVVVWWKGGGFVCAPAAEMDEEERESRCIADQVRNARSQLAEARKERQARIAAQIDIVLPPDAESAAHAGELQPC